MLSTGKHFPPGTTEEQRWAKLIKLILSRHPVKNYFDMFKYWENAYKKAQYRRIKSEVFNNKYPKKGK